MHAIASHASFASRASSARALTSRRSMQSQPSIAASSRARTAHRRAPARVTAHHGPMTALMFTPDNALAGGLILGSMTIAKKLNTGTNLGISGETKAAMRGEAKASTAAFLLGLFAAGYVAPMILGAQVATPMVEAPRAIIAGALVGLGTSVGCGCTSGHGISGIGRFNIRSMLFTCIFMIVGAATVAATGTLDELHVSQATKTISNLARAPEVNMVLYSKVFAAGVAIQGALYALAKAQGGGVTSLVEKLSVVSDHVSGLFFGLGLVISGMTNPAKVAGFLAVTSQAFDPSLAFVMGGALSLVVATTYVARGILKIQRPAMAREFKTSAKYIDNDLIIGAVLFGAGWGLAGVCPGPGLVSLVMNSGREITLWCLSFLLAQRLHLQFASECAI